MERLYRVLGQELVDHWIERGSLSDDFNPWYHRDLSTYDTPEKRREIVESEYRIGLLRRTGSTMIMLHPNYTLAFIEREADEVEYNMAAIIQTHVRGLLARNRFWSPYTEIGRTRLIKMFCNL